MFRMGSSGSVLCFGNARAACGGMKSEASKLDLATCAKRSAEPFDIKTTL